MYSTIGSKRLLACVFAALLAVCASAQVQSQKQDDDTCVKDFQDRVNKYMSLKKQQGVNNSQTNSPDKLVDQKKQARQKTQAARQSAHQGDVFTPEISAYFKQRIAATMQGTEGNKIRTSLRHAEPLPTVQLAVNQRYPQNLPLQSTPPTLLMALPQLPKELEYRIVGSTLVLYDVPSDLVVDLIPGAIAAA